GRQPARRESRRALRATLPAPVRRRALGARAGRVGAERAGPERALRDADGGRALARTRPVRGRALKAGVHATQPRSFSSSVPCNAGFAASTERVPSPTGAPFRSVNTPPASRTITDSAATSSTATSDSTTASILPDASRW